MEEILKQDKSKSRKEFEKMLAADMQKRPFREGEIISGIVALTTIKISASDN